MESVAGRAISEFEKLYIKKTLRSKLFKVNIVKSLLYLLLASPSLLWVFNSDMSLLTSFATLFVTGVALWALRGPISHIFDVALIHGEQVYTGRAVIEKQTRSVTTQHGTTSVETFYANGKELFIPPGSKGVLSECDGKEVELTYVICNPRNATSRFKRSVFSEELILLALHSDDETLIDIHNMLKLYGTRVFASHYLTNFIVFVLVFSVGAFIVYYFIESGIFINANGFVRLAIVFGSIIIWVIASVILLLVLYLLYSKIMKMFNPRYGEDSLSYEEKLKGQSLST